MEPVLELYNISFAYPSSKPVLRDICITVKEGERVALLGNNGAGKSTLFLCCNGVLTPDSGEIAIGGKRLSYHGADLQRLRQGVGLVFQDPDDQMIAPTVEGEVSFGPMNLRLSEEKVRAVTREALVAMNLTELRSRPPHYLSGGEKKRVSIADILAMNPQIILLDEPTASLDRVHTELLRLTLEQLHRRSLALMVSTHDVEFAWSWADRAIVLSEGAVIADAPVAEVFARDDVLKAAGLGKPILFEAGQMLFPKLTVDKLPRSLAELKVMIGEKADA